MTTNEHRDTLRAAYDFDAPRRDNNVFDGWRAEIVDEFLARLEPGGSVLELGAGAGQGAVYAEAQGYVLTAMDLSPANVELARERGVDARVGDFTDSDFFVGEFDGVFAMNSLLHVKKALWSTVLHVIRRALRPGGIASIVVYGGISHEGTLEEEWTDPPRFFAFYTDEDFANLPTPGFRRIACEFRHGDSEEGLHPQVLTLEAV
ncbi:MAG: class I SAM-dependent methyltransferase [Acidimicrobiia bacterium]|nr:class I SAM-dependent methyltransferase [Acidimicrobiia bacterium]